jgi:4-amino-4-deoxy-L-arabinose transferase-like glycosyltransferase
MGMTRLIEQRPRAAFAAFLGLHFALWTALPTLLYGNLPLDLIEALTYGREWQLGYDKLPPLPWWLTEIMYRLFGADVAYYALAQTAVIVAFAAVWATARPIVGARGALAAVLIIDGLHYFQYTAVKFNHDVIQLPLWALAGYAFHAGLRRGHVGHWLLLGICVGAALWAKYFVVVLAAPLALFLLCDRDARRALATPGPWLALASALLIMAPHLVWLMQNDFLPFAYANARASPVRGWFDHIAHPAVFAGSQILFLLPSFAIAAGLFWPRPRAPEPVATDAFDRRIVALLAFGPAASMIALTAATGRGAIAMWGYPLWLFLGLWMVMLAAPALTVERMRRVVSTWGAVFAIFAMAFVINYAVLPFIDHRYRAAFFPGDRVAAELSQRFHQATGRPLRYVIGSMWDGGNVAHYSPEHPRVLIDGSPRRAPWIDLADLRASGALVVWTVGDDRHLPAEFAAIAGAAEVGTPFTLPPRGGANDLLHVGWAVLKPQQ